jgi:hypothetical protein
MSISRKDIKEMGFKYTNDRERITFVKESYNLCPFLLDIVKQIPWDTYHHQGESTFLFERFNDNDDDDGYNRKLPQNLFIKKKVVSKCKHIPYFLFGGWWYEYTNRGTLNQFVDKTGDIDIRVELPEILNYHQWDGDNISEKYNGYDHGYLNENNTLNLYVQHFSLWLFKNIAYLINAIPDEHFIHAQHVTNYKSGGTLIREKHIKHGLLRQFIDNKTMLKTQFVCNFNGTTLEPIEFIIVLNQHINKKLEKRTNLNGVFIDTYNNVLTGNITGMSDRYVLVSQPSYKHKWMNHVQRIKYLNSIFNPSDYESVTLIYDVTAILTIIVLFSDHIMKYFALHETSVKETIEAMVSNFLTYIRSKPKAHFKTATTYIKKMPRIESIPDIDYVFRQIDFLMQRNADPVQPIPRVPPIFTRGGKRKRKKTYKKNKKL